MSECEESLLEKLELLAKQHINESFAGIESDEEERSQKINSNEIVNDPFNPEEISIDTKKISMDTLLRRLEQGTIKLNPDFDFP